MVAIPGKNRSAGVAALIVVTCIGLAAAGCSSSSSSSSSSTTSSSPTPGTATHSGTANVAYASSIQYLNERIVGPAFTKDKGYTYSGRGGAAIDQPGHAPAPGRPTDSEHIRS
jgi:molybdate/tungstate transport system substrate-binding protein